MCAHTRAHVHTCAHMPDTHTQLREQVSESQVAQHSARPGAGIHPQNSPAGRPQGSRNPRLQVRAQGWPGVGDLELALVPGWAEDRPELARPRQRATSFAALNQPHIAPWCPSLQPCRRPLRAILTGTSACPAARASMRPSGSPTPESSPPRDSPRPGLYHHPRFPTLLVSWHLSTTYHNSGHDKNYFSFCRSDKK